MNLKAFHPYRPDYSPLESLERAFALTESVGKAMLKAFQGTKEGLAASVEITDRCNAGCHYCYVYPREWDQKQRLKGYLSLPKDQLDQQFQIPTYRHDFPAIANEINGFQS